MAGRTSNAVTVVVMATLAGGLYVVWSQLAVMVSTMTAPGAPTGGGKADLVQAMDVGTTYGEGEARLELPDAAEEVAEAVAPVRELAADAPAVVAELRPTPAAAPSPARIALQAGDCDGAADALLSSRTLPADAPQLLEGTWGCFEARSGALPSLGGAGGDAAGLTGLEGRLALLERLDARGLQGWVDELLGRGAVLDDVLGDLEHLADLAEQAGRAGLDGLWAQRVGQLEGALQGAAGERGDADAPDRTDALRQRLIDAMDQPGVPAQVKGAWLDAMTLGLDPSIGAPPGAPAGDVGDAPSAEVPVAAGEPSTSSTGDAAASAEAASTAGDAATDGPDGLEPEVCRE